jgi:glycerol-3-phosphate acyltransferase PlsX
LTDSNVPIRVAVDAMGSDLGPRPVVSGALELLAEDREGRYRLILVGDAAKIGAELRKQGGHNGNIEIVPAAEAVEMGEAPSEALKKKDSSIAVGMRLVKEGKADAVLSGGNTGAVMASALLTLGRIEGVSRPAIAVVFPTSKESAMILDVGANAECKPLHLQQFGLMGSIYYSYVFGRPNPTVGLLSIGEEPTKGSELVLASHKMLSESGLNFVGNVEGRDVLKGNCNVVVTDGFTGNVMLKFAEGLYGYLARKIRHQISTNIFSRFAVFLMSPFFRRLKKALDYAEYGGAPLLGVNGVAVICHGGSSPRAFKNGIRLAANMVSARVNEHIQEKLSLLKESGSD